MLSRKYMEDKMEIIYLAEITLPNGSTTFRVVKAMSRSFAKEKVEKYLKKEYMNECHFLLHQEIK